MLVSKTITSGRERPRTNTGQSGYWVRIKVLGIPVLTKFVSYDAMGKVGTL